MKSQELPKFILLPKRSIKSKDADTRNLLTNLPNTRSTESSKMGFLPGNINREVTIIDTISEDGPKLIEANTETINSINSTDSPLRAIPIVEYTLPKYNNDVLDTKDINTSIQTTRITLIVKNRNSGIGIEGMKVIAFTNYKLRKGDSGFTDKNGEVSLDLAGHVIEKLFVYPVGWYWGVFKENVNIQNRINLNASPLDLKYKDCIRSFYNSTQFDATTKVRIGVIDTGVGPHSHLNIVFGQNTVTGEPKSEFEDWNGHGTHVAGLIGSNTASPIGLLGLAPNSEILAFRVFGKNGQGATNYSIIKAIIGAQHQKCDILNLSLGGGPADDIVAEAIQDAKESGMVVIVAAGNDGRNIVSYPAAHPGAIGVSAMGIMNTFPPDSLGTSHISTAPISTINSDAFMASFSNYGTEIDIIGLGVDTISTLPYNAYGSLSGTSMAAPMVAGACASLLSIKKNIYSMPRDISRSNKIEQLLFSNCKKVGFGMEYEGFGIPDPQSI